MALSPPSRSSTSLDLIVCRGEYHRWSPYGHEFKEDDAHFLGGRKHKAPPTQTSSYLHLQRASFKEEFIGNNDRDKVENDPTGDFCLEKTRM